MNTTPIEQKHAESYARHVFERRYQSIIEHDLGALTDLYALVNQDGERCVGPRHLNSQSHGETKQ